MKIQGYAKNNDPIYENLNPLVDYLLNNGYVLKGKHRWVPSPDGWICCICGSGDISGLLKNFSIPETIKVNSKGIFDLGSRSQVLILKD